AGGVRLAGGLADKKHLTTDGERINAVAEQITDQVAEVLFVALLGLQRAPRRNVTDEHPAAPRVGLAGRVGDDLAQQLIDPARPEPVRLLLGGLYPLVRAGVAAPIEPGEHVPRGELEPAAELRFLGDRPLPHKLVVSVDGEFVAPGAHLPEQVAAPVGGVLLGHHNAGLAVVIERAAPRHLGQRLNGGPQATALRSTNLGPVGLCVPQHQQASSRAANATDISMSGAAGHRLSMINSRTMAEEHSSTGQPMGRPSGPYRVGRCTVVPRHTTLMCLVRPSMVNVDRSGRYATAHCEHTRHGSRSGPAGAFRGLLHQRMASRRNGREPVANVTTGTLSSQRGSSPGGTRIIV